MPVGPNEGQTGTAKWEVVMAATLRYGRERAYLGRSLLNFMRIARDAHAPDLTLGEVGDLLFTALEVFIGHAFERPMVLSELSAISKCRATPCGVSSNA